MAQNTAVREQLKALESVQELDLRIDGLARRKNEMPEALKVAEAKLNQLRFQITTKEKLHEEIEKNQRQNKAAQEINTDRLTRSNGKLENVANSQEYQAASKEIDQLKKLNEQLALQLTKLIADGEKVKTEATILHESVATAQADFDAQASKISAETSKLDGELSQLQSERGKYTGAIDRRILAQYDRIRPARAGLGLVPALAGRCKGCNMGLPPQLYNEIQRASAFHDCPSCHRLLFAPQAPGTSA